MKDKNRGSGKNNLPAATGEKASGLKQGAQPGSKTRTSSATAEDVSHNTTKRVSAGAPPDNTKNRRRQQTATPQRSDNHPPPPPQPQKSGGGCAATTLALLALLFSLGVGGAGYYLWQQLQTGQQQSAQKLEQAVAARSGEVESNLQENRQRLSAVEEEIVNLKNEFDSLKTQQQELRTLQHDTTLQELASLNEKIVSINSSMEAAEQRLAELLTQQQNITSRIDEASSTLKKLAAAETAIAALNDRVESADARQQALLNTLEKVGSEAEQKLDIWKLAETEYLLETAAHRLSLEQDIEGAVAALKAASQSLANTTSSAQWSPLQESISTAVSELNSLPRPDLEGIAATLASLEEAASQLPLPKPERHLQSTTLDTSALNQPEDLQSWGSKMWDEVKKLVIIRRGDKPATVALLPPDEAHYLRQNLQLKLESARYALLRNKPAMFQENLRIAQEWIEAHFDTTAEAGNNMLARLQALRDTEFPQALPDLSPLLEQLHELRNPQTLHQDETTPDAAAEGASS